MGTCNRNNARLIHSFVLLYFGQKNPLLTLVFLAFARAAEFPGALSAASDVIIGFNRPVDNLPKIGNYENKNHNGSF